MAEAQYLRGVYTALITPMNEDGSVDWSTLASHVAKQVEDGVDGLVPVGTTGESPTLNTDEHLDVIEAVVKAADGRVPVIAGTGANSTEEALHLTREAELRGADAFLQVAPYYNKPSPEGVFQHFEKIAGITNKPIMLYSIPGRCGIEIAIETIARLVEACPNITAIKEAGGEVERVRAIRKAVPGITVLSGDDGLIPSFIEAGAQGVVSVASNFKPTAVKALTEACLTGNTEAGALYKRWRSLLTDLVFLEGNPVTIKEVLYQSGLIPTVTMRLPLVRMSEENQKKVRQLLDNLETVPA